MSCAKKYPCKQKMIQGYMVAPYTIPFSYSLLMDKEHDKYFRLGYGHDCGAKTCL